jgi:DUF3102 family protein
VSKAIADPKKAYELVSEVKACWRELSKSGRDSTKYAMDIGDLLIRMKENLPHGKFQETIEERFDFSYDTAKNWMKLANHRELVEKRLKEDETTQQLSLRGSMRLIADSKPKKSTSVQGKRERAPLLTEQPSTDFNTPPPKVNGDTFTPSDWEPSEVKDHFGDTVPKELREAFVINAEFDKQRNALTAMKSWITQRVKHAGGKFLEAAESRIKSDIDNLDREIKFAKPYCVCVYCQNKTPKVANCNACKGLGWINEQIYSAAPKEKKRAKANHQTVSS